MRVLCNATTINSCGKQCKEQAIAIENGLIAWHGPVKDIPREYLSNAIIEDCQGQLVTPGLIDCHTHLVYAGDRAGEFQKRLSGMTYADIARQGGGILSTVQATRAASFDELLAQSLPRLLALRSEGVTTVEIKSGYGLDLDTELKMLRVARRLGELAGIRVKTTFLGAHALPLEFKQKPQQYVDFLCQDLLVAVAEQQLADAVDVFCETIGFSLAQTEQLFIKSQALSLPIKCHAEQLSNMGASQLAAAYGALSCDHLEHLDARGAALMANAGTIAVLLPGAFYYLRESKTPPIALLREQGVGMAIATDSNPGTSPTTSLLLMLNMACQFFALTVEEALAGVTANAAKALGISEQTGTIAAGLAADLVHWSVTDSAALCYYFGCPIAHRTMFAGDWLA
ncbi:MAG: imidazolonepropionase [Tatlockia sp.]|jgi:imidazolonepropionase